MSRLLERRYVEKPWGRTHLPAMFDPQHGQRTGEVWFMGEPDLPLLAKYIFTSERLSVQVHPDDAEGRRRGLKSGKSECWYILDADPGATLGLGLKGKVTKDELRRAAEDGSIEGLIDWRPITAGEFVFVPAGTIHAIGAGISLLEFQQNLDITYRLYDYGRPRELHLDDAIAVSKPEPFPSHLIQHLSREENRTLVDGPHFKLRVTHADAFQDQRRWIIPLEGEVRAGGERAQAGDCLLVEADELVELASAQLLIGATARQS